MPIGEICSREVYYANRDATVQEGAELMRKHHVGDLVIADEKDGNRRVPVGIVTDRDIVISVTALKLDPTVITLGDIMGLELITAQEDQGIAEVVEIMKMKGVRRVPIVDHDGYLTGILSSDDVAELLAGELSDLAALVSRQRWKEERTKR
ncbi:MAG: CBS domain-containing protein [Bryobacteraceae bacterium]